jgi:1,4-dihydroxy-2-naphthoate octaprenyltransferase
VTLPIGLFVAWRVIAEPPSRGHNRLLAMSGGQLLIFAALMCWGILKAKDAMP